MTMRATIVDFLGNVLGEDGKPTGSKVFEAEERCRWMEVARSILESYCIAAIQMSTVRIYRSADAPEAADHESWLWNVSPNPNQSRAEFVSEMLHVALTDRDGALVVPITRNRQTQLWLADGYSINEQPGREDRYEYVSIGGSTEVARRSYRASEAYRFRLMPCPGWSDLLTLAVKEYQELGAAAEAAFEDSNAMRYKLSTETPVSGNDKNMQRIAEYIDQSLKPFLKGDRGVLPVYKGFDLTRLAGASSAASWRRSEDIINIRKDMFDAVAAIFRVPVSLLYGNTNNFEAVWTSFVTFCVDPVARAMADEIARKTLTEEEWMAGGRVVVDTSHIKHVDLFDVADKVEKLVGSSIDTPNEIRTFTGQRPSSAPGMDEYQRTKNFETAGEVNTNA